MKAHSALAAVPGLQDVALHGKRVLVREDFNVPLAAGRITSTVRIDAALPTIRGCLDGGAAVLLASHLGRPPEGVGDPSLSLAPVAAELGAKLGRHVPLVRDWHGGVAIKPGQVVLLENVRFETGELADDEALGQRLAALCDVFVMDAFATAHRAHASTCAVARAAPVACAGPLLQAELDALRRAFDDPARPLVAVVGGAKVSTKLAVLESLAAKADALIVGGGIANTFLLAAGASVGLSLAEGDLVATAQRIMAGVDVPLPVDLMTATAVDPAQAARLRPRGDVSDGEYILDIGPETARRAQSTLAEAGTIVWNGPLGLFEYDQFGEGTRLVAQAIAASAAFSIAGGGDTLAAIDKYAVREGISYLSTGGGAFLEFVEGKTLPAIAALHDRWAR